MARMKTVPMGIKHRPGIRLFGERTLSIRTPLVWLVPVAVALGLYILPEKKIVTFIGAVLGLLLLVFLINRPGPALIALVLFLPIEPILFGLLLRWGIPASTLRASSGLKELIALSILVAGLREIRDAGIRLDRIDIAALVYVGVVTIYLIVPHLFSAVAPNQLEVRLLAWRTDAGYVLLFFGARHAPIPARMKERFIQAVMAMGALVGVLGIYQRLAPHSWANFILNTAQVANYDYKVLGLTPDVISQSIAYTLQFNPLHVSSIFLSPYDMGDYLVMVIALTAVRISRNYRSAFNYAVLLVAIGSIFFSRSRSDALGAIIVLVLVALPTSRSPVEGRVRLVGAVALVALLIVPALGGSRFLGAQGGNASAIGHVTEVENGISVIYYNPLGLGLGDQPGTSNRFVTSATDIYGGDISDNLITQVGDELGLQALIPWLLLMGFVLWELKRRAGRGDVFAASLGFALLGIVIAGLYHHVFLTFPVPWTLWAGVGFALSVHHGSQAYGLSTSDPAAAGVP